MSFSSWFRWLRGFLSSLAGEWHSWRRKNVFPPAPHRETNRGRIPVSRNSGHRLPRGRLQGWASLNERRMAWGIA